MEAAGLRHIDYSLYLVTDRGLSGRRPLTDIVAAAVHGGVTCVQLREKTASTREFIRQATLLQERLQRLKIPLIINDRLDVALAVGAAGVHLGQTDMPLETARTIVGDRMVIGVSVESTEDAVAAEGGGADYLGVSPVHATPTKTDAAPPLGLEGLRHIRRAVRLPLVAIGGMNPDNAGEAIRCGADGVAVVSAIVAAADPQQAAERLKQVIERARKK